MYLTYTSPLCPSFLSSGLELPLQSGQGAQYDNPLWGHLPANQSATSATASTNPNSWDQVIIDQKDTEAWPFITHSQSQAPPGGCSSDTDPGAPVSSSSSNSSSMSMATGANGQTGHFPANHPSSKASSGPGPTNHSGAGMLSSQAAANRGWGSGPGPAHCPPQSSVGGDGKSDGLMGGGGSRGWGSSSNTNFNLNLNPNANPSAWPVLGHDGAGTGGGSSGGANANSPPQPPPNLCNLPGAPPAQASAGAMGANGNPSGSGSTWSGMMPSDPSEPHPSPSTNVSFSSEPQNLNTDGPNHTNKHEPPSPIRSLPSWGSTPVGMGTMCQLTSGAPQVNGEDGSSAWVSSGDSKTASSKEASGWDSGSGWGHGGGGAGSSTGWGDQSSGDWGKQHSGEAQGGWDTPGSPPQDQQPSSWSRALSTAGASEGSSDGKDGRSHHREHSSRDDPASVLPAPDLDPRVLCNTGWGQTPRPPAYLLGHGRDQPKERCRHRLLGLRRHHTQRPSGASQYQHGPPTEG